MLAQGLLVYWPLVPIIAEFAMKVALIISILMRRRTSPASNIAWITVILAIPFIGMIAYLLIGERRLGRRRARRHKEIVERLNEPGSPLDDIRGVHRETLGLLEQPIATLSESLSGNPPRHGNSISLFGDTDDAIRSLISDIDQAKHHCHLMVYIMLDDATGRAVSEALVRAEERGVTCRLLLDSVGSHDFLDSPTCQGLQNAGVQVVEMLPANLLRMLFARVDIRNHRKVFVIDGTIGYMGSQNIADASFAPKAKHAPWYDTLVRCTGPVVLDLQAMFVTDWYYDTDEFLEDALELRPEESEGTITAQVLGTGPHCESDAMLHIVHSALHAAREEIIITTPYFVPDEGTVLAMCAAARRGVHTLLIVPRRNDSPLVAAASRGTYERLLNAGVEIHEFTPGLLHSKTTTVDRRVALVGSANLDQRSFSINFEVTMMVYDSDFASELRLLQKSYLNESIAIVKRDWLQRSWYRKLLHQAAGTMSPLL